MIRTQPKQNQAPAAWSPRVAFSLIGTLLLVISAVAGTPPAGVSGEEWKSIQSQIEAEQLKVTQSDRPGPIYRADSPAQRFTAHFGAEALSIAPRGRGEPAWQLDLRLTAWGAAHDLEQVDFASVTADANRVEYRRGPLTEWYVNKPMGLEQGFTIEAPPGDDITELVLEMTIDGDLTPELAASGQAVTFRQGDNSTSLTYSGLKAWDAVDTPLEARMELVGGGTKLRIVVEVTGAAWPVTVDPIFSQVAKLLPTPEEDRSWVNLGQNIAIDGDLLIVGVNDAEHGENTGAAHIYKRDNGQLVSWSHIARISASDAVAHDYFGISVDISGDTAIVGSKGNRQSGSAYIFQRNQGGSNAWGQVAKLSAGNSNEYDRFGFAVAIDGTTAVVGSYGRSADDSGTGVVHVFDRDQGGPNQWGLQETLNPSDGAATSSFGRSVDMSDEVLLVGAEKAAFVYQRDLGGVDPWVETARLSPFPDDDVSSFGESVVRLSENTIVVGAPLDCSEGDFTGAVYVFQREQHGSTTWLPATKLFAENGNRLDRFGQSVAVAEDIIVVGASMAGSHSNGSAFVFEKASNDPEAWSQVAEIQYPGQWLEAHFGSSVAISGDVAFVGSPNDDDEATRSGAVYLLQRGHGDTGTWFQSGKLSFPEVYSARGYQFGSAVAISRNTMIVGAPGDNKKGPRAGAAYLFIRDESNDGTWKLNTKLVAQDGETWGLFGVSVSICGDTAIVGAPGQNSTDGSAYCFRGESGNPEDWELISKISPPGSGRNRYFGIAVAIDGDLAVVGASGKANNHTTPGEAHVFARDHQTGSAWRFVASLIPSDGAPDDYFGGNVAIDGDTVVVGALGHDGIDSDSGSVYVFQPRNGDLHDWVQISILTHPDGAAGDQFGNAVAVFGDSILVGCRADDDHGASSGSALLFGRNRGGPNMWGLETILTAPDAAPSDAFGKSVGIIDDIIAVGARGDADNGSWSGSVYFFKRRSGTTDGWDFLSKNIASDGTSSDHFGNELAISTEVVVVGAPDDDDIGDMTGSVYVLSPLTVRSTEPAQGRRVSPDPSP
ncbi:MAG: FG-GAP repeat protein [Thermoanaerobaculales bacterium]|nr:FG-GAP repeat protein [Thermoanaerobaculales bacterium]